MEAVGGGVGRRRPSREDGGGVYGPSVAGPWERVVTGMIVAAQSKVSNVPRKWMDDLPMRVMV